MGDIAAARRMLETFASCGAESFVITKTKLEWPGHKEVLWGHTYSLDELRGKLPAMVRTASRRKLETVPGEREVLAGENLIIRPSGSNVAFIQLDDLAPEQLDKVRDAACIIHATSSGNYQAWIAVTGVPEGKEQFKEFSRRVRNAVGSFDKSASGATRVAGTENFKLKYAPNYPTVTIVETHPGRVMTTEQLASMDLLSAKPEPVKAANLKFTESVRGRSKGKGEWPSYEESLSRAGPNQEGTGSDRSTADFWWCYFALRNGFSREETEAKLLEVSERAQERARGGDKGYARVTVENAAERLQSNRRRHHA
jgi:RepB DNA-primase from phage plasmid